jgi:murein DD-endopeptidase MepM/ murein hydrolase activator NlpD
MTIRKGNGNMGKTSKFIMVIVMALTPCMLWAAGMQPAIQVEPAKPGPGDIMLVTLKNTAGDATGTFLGKRIYFNSSEESLKAIVAIDYFTEPGSYDLEITSQGTVLKQPIEIVKKEYEVQRLELPNDMVQLSPENEARAERDQKRMTEIWPEEHSRFWSGDFINPLDGEIISSFGLRRFINNTPKSPHTGVDVRGKSGDKVHAPNDAIVALVDNQFFAGNAVVLDHGQGIYTMFFHLSKVLVKPGQRVKKGEVFALVGQTGRATGPHLHWGARVQGARIDPLQLIHLKLD